jgi:hypothetical protein
MHNSYALDLNKYKSKIRSHMADMLGSETTNKILGEEEKKNTIELPDIPIVKLDAKDASVYDVKSSPVYTQGEKYNSLPEAKKRSYRISFLQQLFEVTRNSEAKKEDIVKLLNVLEQGGNREGVYRAVTLDQVYLALEQYDETPSDELVNFAEYFPTKFLRKKYGRASIQKLNLWSLKRLLAEKCLELLDVFADTPENLYKWYAVFSSELATDHPGAWISDTRKKTSDIYHYNWAKSVPFQHIKSEVVIKVHRVMNHLNKSN